MTATAEMIPLASIRAEVQIRMRNGLDEDSLRELAGTIREVGVIEPIVVRPDMTPGGTGYIVIAGERRLLACELAGLDAIPAIIRRVDPKTATAIQAIENLQRVDLSLADTAQAVATMVASYGSVKETARVLGKSVSWVSKHQSVAKLQGPLQAALLSDECQDAELLLALDQIRRMKSAAAALMFDELLNGMDAGTTTRASVREALERLKKVEAASQLDGDEGGDEGEGAELPTSTSTKAMPGMSASKTLQLLDSCAVYARSAISSIEGGNPVAAKLLMQEFLGKVTETRKGFAEVG
ncbi:MAG: ParB/RepB/Spo0J family partition protein [Vitreoscilla sp.]|nr:ParB/RepB/Spo0J family partition protein [Vitreoscilla sp.]